MANFTIDLALYGVDDVTCGLEERMQKDGRASHVRVHETLSVLYVSKQTFSTRLYYGQRQIVPLLQVAGWPGLP
jgi:hypothetical protein